MKIGVVSDTHIPDRATALPKEVLQGLIGVDMIIHAGDIIDLMVLEKLKTICNNLVAVRGNMDPFTSEKKLPEKEIITAGKYKIGVMHGNGHPSKLIEFVSAAFKKDTPDIIIFGHSHAPCNEKRGNILFFNPGSPTDKIFSPYNSYGIIEINEGITSKIVKI